MIAILHGYLLEGSGSNLWTRSIIQSLCNNGETVHLVCQENHPDIYDFISKVIQYHGNGDTEILLDREVPFKGRCIMHKPKLGDTLPVYVSDKYEEFSNVQPMTDLDDAEIERYLSINTDILGSIVEAYGITVLHANHAVLMSVVAQRVARKQKIPFAIMPHGSAIEYAVKKDRRFFRYAEEAFAAASRIYVIGKEIRERVKNLFPGISGLEAKMRDLNLGVNTSLFKPVEAVDRQKNINRLIDLLRDVPRGKSIQQSDHMLAGMSRAIPLEELTKIITGASGYNAKFTDAGIEDKLQAVDWKHDKIILFVGRLIANKGLHSVIAALPQILESEPRCRLVVVGHGPLREPLEAMIWALQHGYADLVANIVDWARGLENSGPGPLEEMKYFFNGLKNAGELDNYFENAARYIKDKRIIFTGYLTHRELCYLFPVCDVAVFPSVVAEAGPLVFLEAMASGCFPIGTYFAGMAASIDSVSPALPGSVADAMKLSPEPEQTVRDIIRCISAGLRVEKKYREILREVAVNKYDWKNISAKLAADLGSL